MSDQRSAPAGDNEHFETAGLATKAIHAGYRPDPSTGAVNAPIYASSTFAQDGVGGLRGGFEYARTGNPTRAALETALAAVEDGQVRPGVRFRHGGQRLCAAGAAAPRRPRGDPRRRLRRNVPADRQGVHRVGCAAHPGRVVRSRRGPRGGHPAHPADLGGNAHQPAAVDRRYRRNRRAWHRALCESVGGQHVCVTGAAAAVDARRRHRVALDHEVHRRPLRCGGRRPGHQRRGVGRGVRVLAERGRRGAGTVRCLPDHARPEDAGAAHAAAQRKRRCGRGIPRRARHR